MVAWLMLDCIQYALRANLQSRFRYIDDRNVRTRRMVMVVM